MSERVENSLGGERTQATLLGSGGVLALLLAAVGLYGVMSYSVAQRTREIGISMALGAGRGNVMGLVLKQGCHACVGRRCAGPGGAFVTTRLLASLLFGVSAEDPVTFVGNIRNVDGGCVDWRATCPRAGPRRLIRLSRLDTSRWFKPVYGFRVRVGFRVSGFRFRRFLADSVEFDSLSETLNRI